MAKTATYRYIILAAVLLLLFVAAPTEGTAQYFSNYDPNNELFTSEVKLIDEFIERFNNYDSTFLKKMYARQKKKGKITRGMMLVSLFNLENSAFTDKDTSLKDFFRQVMDKVHPVYLSFADTDWYAESQGVFLYNGKLVEIPLVLHVKSKGDEWSKWMITGIGNMVASKEPMPSVSTKRISGKAPEFIATSAYATNFVELHRIFSGDMQPQYYFEPELLNTDNGRQFTSSIKSGQLKFQYVKKITFHFYQVRGWVFTVDEFTRKTYNSGWLISSARKMSEPEKKAARQHLLNR
jgi:hypothetical protein